MKAAIEKFDDYELNGRRLRVTEDRSKKKWDDLIFRSSMVYSLKTIVSFASGVVPALARSLEAEVGLLGDQDPGLYHFIYKLFLSIIFGH